MESYDEILTRMIENYESKTGITPAKESDIYVRLSVLAGEIFSTKMSLEYIKSQTQLQSASGEFLDSHGALRGLKRYKASKAFGEVIFSLSGVSDRDVLIPKGVVVSAGGDEEALCFETTQEVTILKGNTSVHANIQAVSEGRKYNVRAGSVRNFTTAVSFVTSVTNPDDLEGGSDMESDESFRERIVESLKNPPCATNCSYYKNTALSVSGVSGAGVVPKVRGAGTVDVYIAAQGAQVSDETLLKVQALLSQEREVNVDVKVQKANEVLVNYYLQIDVKDGYDFAEVKKKCKTALSDYIARSGVGGKLTLTKAGERIIHIEGVEDYSFSNYTNKDIDLSDDEFARENVITVVEGV